MRFEIIFTGRYPFMYKIDCCFIEKPKFSVAINTGSLDVIPGVVHVLAYSVKLIFRNHLLCPLNLLFSIRLLSLTSPLYISIFGLKREKRILMVVTRVNNFDFIQEAPSFSIHLIRVVNYPKSCWLKWNPKRKIP
jgi:hypothetical protein